MKCHSRESGNLRKWSEIDSRFHGNDRVEWDGEKLPEIIYYLRSAKFFNRESISA